jgi:hypothetical protein
MLRYLLALAFAGFTLIGPAEASPQPRETKSASAACPPGFAALQDSDICVRISGRVRAEGVIGSSRTRTSDSFRTHAGGRVQLDVRKQTEYGPLRAVIRAEMRR